MSEVTDEEQAAMAIKLADNVRELIRAEMRVALEDYGFLNHINLFNFSERLSPVLFSNVHLNYTFRDGVKGIIKEQMGKP